MSTGQIVFYAGIGLLCITLILLVVFLIKKPQYHPENVIYSEAEDKSKPHFRSHYISERMPARGSEPYGVKGTEIIEHGNQMDDKTELL